MRNTNIKKSILSNFLEIPVTSSHLDPYTFLCTLLSNTRNLFSSAAVRKSNTPTSKTNFTTPYNRPWRPIGGRGVIALLFFQPWRWMGMGGERHASAALSPGMGQGTHCAGWCVGPRAERTNKYNTDNCNSVYFNLHIYEQQIARQRYRIKLLQAFPQIKPFLFHTILNFLVSFSNTWTLNLQWICTYFGLWFCPAFRSQNTKYTLFSQQ